VERQEHSAEDLGRYFLSGEGLRGFQAGPHEHGTADGGSTSVREFDHRGHRARIETTYRITIDGQPCWGTSRFYPTERCTTTPSRSTHLAPPSTW
jgi:hypothetical protein